MDVDVCFPMLPYNLVANRNKNLVIENIYFGMLGFFPCSIFLVKAMGWEFCDSTTREYMLFFVAMISLLVEEVLHILF